MDRLIKENLMKLEKDGMIAIVYSPGYGAGWSTWDYVDPELLCTDSEIAQAVLDGDTDKAEQIAKSKVKDVYTGGSSQS